MSDYLPLLDEVLFEGSSVEDDSNEQTESKLSLPLLLEELQVLATAKLILAGYLDNCIRSIRGIACDLASLRLHRVSMALQINIDEFLS